jgi:subtilisin family serine protease
MIRSVLVVLAAVAATAISAGPVAAQDLKQAPAAASAAKKLHLAASPADARSSRVYVVRMAAKPVVSYEGDVSGFAKSAPDAGQRFDARSGASQSYARYLRSQQDALLASVGATDRKIYSYVHAMNGFAARLTPAEAAKLRKDKSVVNVWEDRLMRLDTNNSPRFLGLNNPNSGLRSALGLTGEDVIIGVIDTGLWPESPSFAGDNFGPPPAHWAGICQSGENWSTSTCNNKVIGARWFGAGFTSAQDLAEGEFLSARDSDGHGTHTASTAGGNRAQATFMNGNATAPVSGMAPRARIAVYKACWTGPDFSTTADDGCFFSDSAAATDAAVADGVDVINFSVGTAAAFDDPQDIAFLFAADAGVFVARSAGNEGPGAGSTSAGEPWVTTVGASTHRGDAFTLAAAVNAPESVAGDYPALEGAITRPLSEAGALRARVRAADPIDACTPIEDLAGIVLIARGTCTFDVKITNAVNAGAAAVLMYSDARPKTVMGGAATPVTQSIPGVMVDNAVGVALLAEITDGESVIATLDGNAITTEAMTGNVMAGFSSRGPYLTVPNWIKPDVTAPGVQVLAGDTGMPADGSDGEIYQYLQGTSMSTPHVAGIAALLRQAHPDWSPAAIKSALMTTARTNVKKEDGVSRANPFDFGAGHIVPNNAVDPGLVYDTDFLGYLAATCDTATPFVSPDDCDFLGSIGYPPGASNLNIASIAVDGVIGTQRLQRTVTNVSDAEATYTATVAHPPGFRVIVVPSSLTLAPGESATFEVRIRNGAAPPGVWRFGSLTWSDGAHEVRSPIAVNARTLIVPEEIAGTGADGSTSFDVAFGYTGEYTAAPHGLAEPTLTLFEVTDDPNNSFDFNFEADEPIVFLADLPPGTVYAQWQLFNDYNDNPGHDLDMYLFYCPDFACTLIDASLGATSDERVSVTLPVSDDTIDDPYVVFVHGFNTAGGAPATSIQFDWSVLDDLGNLTVTGPASATAGDTETVDLQWAGLPTGPGEKQAGAVSHSDASGVIGLTIVNIENDEGAGFCDLVAC